ncbi:MAG: sigma-70 family RNA polymerase sigma factor [Actinomycetota bacterium]
MPDPPQIHDADLMAAIRGGDEDAFRRLFRRYAPTAQSLAHRILRQPFLAEEIVQEVFLAVWRDPFAHDPNRGSVKSWVMGMVHHRSVDAVRREEAQRRRAREAIPDIVDVSDDPGVTVPEEIGLPEERTIVRSALAELPAEQRRVLELMYFGGRSQSQIAEDLSLPLGTVKSRTLLGMRRMRTALVGIER